MSIKTTDFTIRRSAIWEGNMQRHDFSDPIVVTVKGTGETARKKAQRVIKNDIKGNYVKGMGQRWMLVDNADHSQVLNTSFVA